MLLDYYGKLLSNKQYDAISNYYFDDFSIQEIADNSNVSKQAISDLIRRSEKKLNDIEDELKMLQKTMIIKDNIEGLIQFIDSSENLDPHKSLILDKLSAIIKSL